MAVVNTKAGWIQAIRQLEAGAGLPVATTAVAGVVKKAAAQADFAGADIAALKVELNAFLAKLKAAGQVT